MGFLAVAVTVWAAMSMAHAGVETVARTNHLGGLGISSRALGSL
ncbi:hypothetical protein ACGF13_21705 [Kitasatospora sp. NPDC048286]